MFVILVFVNMITVGLLNSEIFFVETMTEINARSHFLVVEFQIKSKKQSLNILQFKIKLWLFCLLEYVN